MAITLEDPQAAVLGSWGADRIVHVANENVEEDVATAVVNWTQTAPPWAILVGSTAWGREVASRVAARLDAGLTGDAVDLEVSDGRLIAWKPAFGGQLVAAIGATSPVQMATVRAGMITALAPRTISEQPPVSKSVTYPAKRRVRVLARTRDDDLEVLADADVVLGIGRGVAPDEYEALEPLRTLLGAELGATRKVTDEGWLPRARQVGLTGRSIAPRLFVSIGASGKFNHTVGLRAGAHGARDQPRSRRAHLPGGRHRHRRRLARRAAAPRQRAVGAALSATSTDVIGRSAHADRAAAASKVRSTVSIASPARARRSNSAPTRSATRGT